MSLPYYFIDLPPLSDADRDILMNARNDGAIITLPPAQPVNALHWQPMDTAPAGERILLWLDGGEGKRGIREGFLVDAERGEWCYQSFNPRDDDTCGCNGDPDPVAWAHKPAGPSWGGAA